MKKKRRIKKVWIVVLILVLVLLAALASIYIWQQENIKAAANARKYTQKQLEQQLSDSRESMQEALDQHPDITVRDLNEEERQALRSGELSPEELIEMLITPTEPEKSDTADDEKPDVPAKETPPPASSTETPTPGTPTTTVPPTQPPEDPEETARPEPTKAPNKPVQDTYETELSRLVAQIYVLREQYTAQLDALITQAKAEYKAMPKSERTKAKLASWGSGYVALATDLEKDCDVQVRAIASQMNTLIKENGGDTSIVNELVFAYAEEKSIQKSIYIQELEKRGIMS